MLNLLKLGDNMNRVFCKDKKGFCDCIEHCIKCKFAKGNGIISGYIAHDLLATFFGIDYDINHICELAEADRDGRCFVADIKLGGEVFYIPRFNGKPCCGIKVGHAQSVSFTKSGKRIKIREYHPHNQDFMIGKTVFLTRESAEAALKKHQNEEDC